jgi:hypothetical protein
MKKEIAVYSDDYSVTIKTIGAGQYTLTHGEFSTLELSEEQLRELKYMIEEIIELANKRDY